MQKKPVLKKLTTDDEKSVKAGVLPFGPEIWDFDWCTGYCLDYCVENNTKSMNKMNSGNQEYRNN